MHASFRLIVHLAVGRVSGLNLIVAAIALWNTVYLERAAKALARSRAVDYALFQHVSPLGWERRSSFTTRTILTLSCRHP